MLSPAMEPPTALLTLPPLARSMPCVPATVPAFAIVPAPLMNAPNCRPKMLPDVAFVTLPPAAK